MIISIHLRNLLSFLNIFQCYFIVVSWKEEPSISGSWLRFHMLVFFSPFSLSLDSILYYP